MEAGIIDVSGVKVGGKKITVIAGTRSAANGGQLTGAAKAVKQSGAALLYGSTAKDYARPYPRQGLSAEELELLKAAKRETGLPVVVEVMSAGKLASLACDADLIQVGACSMQNIDLLQELGKTARPVLLNRGPSATIEEWLLAAECIMEGGNANVILCERGIRTFEAGAAGTLDLSSIPAVKRLSSLPVLADLSSVCGRAWMVEPLAKAAIAAGADGLIVEVAGAEAEAADGMQPLRQEGFAKLMEDLNDIAIISGRKM